MSIELLLNDFKAVAEHPHRQADAYKAQGKKIIGVLPYYAPEELVYAAGMVPMGIWGTNKKTIVNLTHHGFFNLAGIANPSPTVENVLCEINADYYLPIDETSIPTGEVRFVKDTPFDFRTPKAIGQDINADNEQIKNGTGYDHNYVLNKKEEGELSFAARLTEPTSGRTMEVYTTEPGIQLYTGNFLFGFEGAHGATFPKRSAVCLEAQHFPDTPNHPYFPSVVLTPGGQYKQKTIYKFGVAK